MTLGRKDLVFGRHPECDVPIKDDRISRRHCAIQPDGRGWKVVDLGSRNGTKVNGQRVRAAALADGDMIKFGGVLIRFAAAEVKSKSKVEPLQELAARDEAAAPADGAAAVREADAAAANAKPVPSSPAAEQPQKPAKPEKPRKKKRQAAESEAGPSLHLEATIRELQRLLEILPQAEIDETQFRLIDCHGREGSAEASEVTGGRLVRLLLMLCAATRATDMHVEPLPEHTAVRLRVDGMMVDLLKMPVEVGGRLHGVIKVLCDIDITQKNIIQEGHFSARTPDRSIDYRVSFTPTVQGQKLVLRVLDLAHSPLKTRDLQMPKWMADTIRRTIARDHGMILVCGPTGSGKTTTLYAALREIDRKKRNVITIEDPVEYRLEHVTQIPINERQGNTFDQMLRSVLRQDPDVIMLGEIRDAETARIAMQASVTGHLVLSTVHARDAIGTMFRLMNLEVEPHLIASAIHVVLAQRLIRRLCPHCRTRRKLMPSERMKMGPIGEKLTEVYTANGCPRCLNTGYLGRQGLYEMLTATEEIREILLTQPSMQELRKAVRNTMFTSLTDSGYKLVAEGVTDLAEIERVTGSD